MGILTMVCNNGKERIMRKSKWILAAMAMAVATGNVASVIAGDETVPAAPATTNVVKQQTMCPVMGGGIDKQFFADYQGKRVYFCCNACPATFKKDPTKYIKKMEAEGITLDKTPQAAAMNAPAAVAPQGK